MKKKLVDTVTSNEEHVRLAIYDGAIPLDRAAEELHRLQVAQLESKLSQLSARLRAGCPHCGAAL